MILCQELARAVRTYVFGDNDNIKGRQHQKHVDVTQPNPTVTAVLCNQTFNANKEAPDTEGHCLKRLLCLAVSPTLAKQSMYDLFHRIHYHYRFLLPLSYYIDVSPHYQKNEK